MYNSVVEFFVYLGGHNIESSISNYLKSSFDLEKYPLLNVQWNTLEKEFENDQVNLYFTLFKNAIEDAIAQNADIFQKPSAAIIYEKMYKGLRARKEALRRKLINKKTVVPPPTKRRKVEGSSSFKTNKNIKSSQLAVPENYSKQDFYGEFNEDDFQANEHEDDYRVDEYKGVGNEEEEFEEDQDEDQYEEDQYEGNGSDNRDGSDDDGNLTDQSSGKQ